MTKSWSPLLRNATKNSTGKPAGISVESIREFRVCSVAEAISNYPFEWRQFGRA